MRLLNEHPTIPDFPFRTMLHVNYAETVLPFHDGLPKQKDYPKEMGGSGELVPESAPRALAV